MPDMNLNSFTSTTTVLFLARLSAGERGSSIIEPDDLILALIS
jgi:hypothetical protein